MAEDEQSICNQKYEDGCMESISHRGENKGTDCEVLVKEVD